MEVDGVNNNNSASVLPTGTSRFHFQTARQNFMPVISQSLVIGDATMDHFEEMFNKENGSATDKKLAVEQAFKDTILQLITEKKTADTFEATINMAIEATRKGFCNATLPVILLSDIFDCLTISKCEGLFSFVESHVDTWKLELFFNSTKNNLLRICNDLLRRLSRSQNTVFCGRILLFLAKFFPLSERSGLNVASEFNLENITIFGSSDDGIAVGSFSTDLNAEIVEMEVHEKSASSIRIDYNLYRKFWSLQDYFRNPSQCYNKVNWRGFITYSDEVLKAFASCKLDDVKSMRGGTATSTGLGSEKNVANQEIYFAKYLTNPKLLDLQLNDSNFRRCVLVQFLILFQYLNSHVKSRLDTHALMDEQMQWIKNTKERILTLLGETPPDGVKFAEVIEHILTREEHWNQWKNDGCPEFSAPTSGDLLSSVKAAATPLKPKRLKRKVGDEVRIASANKKVLLGNASLTKLWNVYPNNMDACCSQKRDFLPSLESFFEDAIEQTNPVNMIEDAYKHVHNSNYGWRALRLLARRSPHFFTPSNQPISRLPLYLETMIMKVAKELPTSTEELRAADRGEKGVVDGGGEDSDDELLKNSEYALKEETGDDKADESPGNELTDEQIELIAEKLGSDWKKIAPLLSCEEDEIVYYESECSESVAQGHKMLTVWRDNFREKATPAQVVAALNSAGLQEIAKSVFSEESG